MALVTSGDDIAASVTAGIRPDVQLDPFDGFDDTYLMTPGEVAAKMRVDSKTVTRWAQLGKVPCIRTIGGHRRFYVRDLRAMIEQGR